MAWGVNPQTIASAVAGFLLILGFFFAVAIFGARFHHIFSKDFRAFFKKNYPYTWVAGVGFILICIFSFFTYCPWRLQLDGILFFKVWVPTTSEKNFGSLEQGWMEVEGKPESPLGGGA